MKKSASKFKQAVAKDSHRQKIQRSKYGYLNLPSGINIFKEEPNTKVLLDFLPYEVSAENHPDRDDEIGIATPGSLWYKRPFKIHRNIGNENEAEVCLSSIGKSCPICIYRAKRLKEGAEKEEVDSLRPSNRNLYIVIPKDHKDYEEKPHIWDISSFLFQNMLNDEIEEDSDRGVFPDLEEGLTVRIRFSEAQIGKNKFAETSRIDFIERDEQYDVTMLKDMPDLDNVLNILDYKQLEAKFFGADEIVETDMSEKGSRKIDEEEKIEEEEEIEEEEKEVKKGIKRSLKPVTKKKNKCTYKHTFGKDCEEYDECDDCEIWDQCIDAKTMGNDDVPF